MTAIPYISHTFAQAIAVCQQETSSLNQGLKARFPAAYIYHFSYQLVLQMFYFTLLRKFIRQALPS